MVCFVRRVSVVLILIWNRVLEVDIALWLPIGHSALTNKDEIDQVRMIEP